MPNNTAEDRLMIVTGYQAPWYPNHTQRLFLPLEHAESFMTHSGQRSVFGMWSAYYFVGVRAALAIMWYGIQLYLSASLLANMLRAVFGHNYTDIPNDIPKSVGITSAGMLAFFLFWLIHMPLTFFRPYQLRKFFWFKAIVMLPAIWVLFIFCMVTTKGRVGVGHLKNTFSAAQTSGWRWFFVWSINAGMGNTATLITN